MPLDTSLPDVCVRERLCFAREIQEAGGMRSLLWDRALMWALTIALGAVPAVWVHPLMLAVVLGPALLITAVAAVVYRVRGHRGRCWIARSLNIMDHLEEIMGVVSLPYDLGMALCASVLEFVYDLPRRLWRRMRR